MGTNYTKTPILSGYNIDLIETNFDDILAALDRSLSRYGDSPNQMEFDFDLNSNDLLNGKQGSFQSLQVNGQNIVGGESLVAADALDVAFDDTSVDYTALTVQAALEEADTDVQATVANTTTNTADIVTINSTLSGYGDVVSANLLDEDDMVSDSDTDVPSQQSVKAYVDNSVAASGQWVVISSGDFSGLTQDITLPTSGYRQIRLHLSGVGSIAAGPTDYDLSVQLGESVGTIRTGGTAYDQCLNSGSGTSESSIALNNPSSSIDKGNSANYGAEIFISRSEENVQTNIYCQSRYSDTSGNKIFYDTAGSSNTDNIDTVIRITSSASILTGNFVLMGLVS